MGKGAISPFPIVFSNLFPQCFQKACFPGASKSVIVWEWVKPLTTQSLLLMTPTKRPLENNVGKREILVTAFSPQITFFTLPKTNFNFLVTFIFLSANACKIQNSDVYNFFVWYKSYTSGAKTNISVKNDMFNKNLFILIQ